MSHTQLPAVLDNIIALTEVKDSDELELALIQMLLSISNVKKTTIYSAGSIIRTKHALANNQPIADSDAIPANMLTALAICLETAKPSITHIDENKILTLFPLMNARQTTHAVIAIEQTNSLTNHGLIMQILNIYHNFSTLMNENEHDSLTGLLNRKTFDLKINDIISSLSNNNENLSNNSHIYLAILDIDNFKKINDMHGHLMGDEVLLLLSDLMRKNFRDKDLLFRFGGEEFVGIFQCADNDTIMHILNRFRKAIEDFNFPQVGKVTVSCGFTRIQALDLSSKVIDRADTALYHAKNNGRNHVCQHEQLIESGLLLEKQTSEGEIEFF
jgi:diguanylate cyclase (GGDEF)-like protein